MEGEVENSVNKKDKSRGKVHKETGKDEIQGSRWNN